MDYNDAPVYLSPLQIGHMRRALLTTWRSKQLTTVPDCPDLVLDTDYTIENGEISIYCGDIRITNNSVFTINGTLQMDEGRRIIIERSN